MLPSQQELREEGHRHAITEILFFASIGDVARMKALCDKFNVAVSDAKCCDYDKRTPLHLAAAEGQMPAAEWLLKKNCNVNPVDRFARTPLEDALIGDHEEMQRLLLSKGAKVFRKGVGLIEYPGPDKAAWDSGSGESQQTNIRFYEGPGSGSGARPGGTGGHGTSGSSGGHARRLLRRESSLYVLPELLSRRAADLGGLELDKLIGRGSFGRVYRATWRGGIVAVKVLSHEGSRTAKLNALHESLVSAHVHHPNVVMTYQVHTVQHIDTPDDDGAGGDEQELVLRSFRIRKLADPLRPRSLSQLQPPGGGSPGGSAFAAAASAAFGSVSRASLDTWGSSLGAEGSESQMLRANSPLLASASSASIVASPFATTVERVMSPEVAGEAGEWEPEGAVAQLAKRMSMELASEAATKQRTKPPLRGAKSAEVTVEAAARSQREAAMAAAAGGAPAVAQAGGTPVETGRTSGPAMDSLEQPFSLEDADATVETLLLMEYADMGTLDQRIVQGGLKGDLVSMLLCLIDISAGMSYLHSIGLLHSDLKGANVLLKSCAVTPTDPRGYMCKIADFGMSRVLENNMTHVSTNTHGTVAYMSPEMLQRGVMTMPADVYSFAMLMLELWVGDIVYKGINSHQVLFKVFSGQKPDIPADMPADYRALMEACWSTDPAARPTFKAIYPQLRAMLAAARGSAAASAAAGPANITSATGGAGGSAAGAQSPKQV